MKLYPLLFEPVLKDYIWGGRNLETILGRKLPPGKIAESWEIAAHEDGTTVVANGRFAGTPLIDLQQQLGLDLIGSSNQWAQERGKFPLLIKLLDAHQPLSVQVHPDDAYALAHEGNELGKTEMWVVLRASEEAAVILGVTPQTTRQAFRQAIDAGQLEPFLHRIPVKAGDVVCVPAGSLHTILGGLLIAEIQQNSNTTYRVYDWNRLQADGTPRPLHVDQAMDVVNFDQVAPGLCQPELISNENGLRRYRLCHNQYFTTERIEISPRGEFVGKCNGRSLEIWGVLEGQAMINDLTLTAVRFTLLPAALGVYKVKGKTAASAGSTQIVTLLRTYVA
jgi:mannose-6-phosphate isomerase